MKDGENNQYPINFWEIVSAFRVELPLQKIGCRLEYNGLDFAGITFLPLLCFINLKSSLGKKCKANPPPPTTTTHIHVQFHSEYLLFDRVSVVD